MSAWRHMIRLSDLARGPVSVTLEPDAEVRAAIAKELALEGLPALQGRITVGQATDAVMARPIKKEH